jgi:dolichol-phosphate mannosyltransferase
VHYLLANVIAIVIASVSNFIANDRWTFRHHRKP